MRDGSCNSSNTADTSYVQTVVTVSNIQTVVVTSERGRQNYNLFLSTICLMINEISELLGWFQNLVETLTFYKHDVFK